MEDKKELVVGKYELVKLHDHKGLINEVVDLLNAEWPRNQSSRFVFLELAQVLSAESEL